MIAPVLLTIVVLFLVAAMVLAFILAEVKIAISSIILGVFSMVCGIAGIGSDSVMLDLWAVAFSAIILIIDIITLVGDGPRGAGPSNNGNGKSGSVTSGNVTITFR